MNVIDWTRVLSTLLQEKQLEAICNYCAYDEVPKLPKRYITEDENSNRVIIKSDTHRSHVDSIYKRNKALLLL